MGTKSAHGALKLDLAVPCALASSSGRLRPLILKWATTTIIRRRLLCCVDRDSRSSMAAGPQSLSLPLQFISVMGGSREEKIRKDYFANMGQAVRASFCKICWVDCSISGSHMIHPTALIGVSRVSMGYTFSNWILWT
jgi:hypothetical protein